MATKKKTAKKKAESCIICEGPNGEIRVMRGSNCSPGFVRKLKEKVKRGGIVFPDLDELEAAS